MRAPKGRRREARARPSRTPAEGDLIIRARTARLLWRVAHAARAVLWAPEQEDCGATVYALLDDAIDDLDAHVRSGDA